MNLSRWRNRFQFYRGLLAPILVLLAIPFMIVGLIIEWWWFALAVFATLSAIGVFNYRDFILMSKIGGGFRA